MGICHNTECNSFIKKCSDGKSKSVEQRKVKFQIEENNENTHRQQSIIVASKLPIPGPKISRIPKTKIPLETNQKEVELTVYNLKKKVFDIKKLTAQYEDKEFLPCLDSLMPRDESNPVYTKVSPELVKELLEYKWLRCNELYGGVGNYRLILPSDLNPEDIIQGKLGNCYFLAAVTTLIFQHYEKFKALFELTDVKEKGIYAIRCFIQGIPKVILIDDFIPCKIVENNKYGPAFSRSRDREICIILLEKAWAKINSKCYLKTWSGTPQEAFHALCEAPCTYDLHETYIRESKTDLLWQRLRQAEKNKWMLTTISENNENIQQVLGLPLCHAFAILGIYEINTLPDNKKKQEEVEVEDLDQYVLKLLKLRNPTGEDMANFTGEFCDSSRRWTREYKRVTEYESKRKGTFYVTFEEYYQFFHWTFVCRYFPNYVYNYGIFLLFGDKCILNKTSTMLLRKSTKAAKNTPITIKTVNFLDNGKDFESINVNHQKMEALAIENTMLKRIGTLNVSINFNNITSKTKCVQISPPLLKSQHEYITSSSDEEDNENITNNPKTPHTEEVDAPDATQLGIIKNPSIQDPFASKHDLSTVPKGISKLKVLDGFNYDIFQQLIFVVLEVEKNTRCFLGLHQPQLRFTEDDPEYQIPLAFFIVVRYSSSTQGYIYIGSDIGNIDKLFIDAQLVPGEYHIFANSYWPYKIPLQLVVSTYSEEPVLMNQYPTEELAPNWIEAILVDIAKKNSKKEMIYNNNEPNAVCFSSVVPCDSSNYTGFGIFYYENNSAREDLEVNLVINKNLGVKFLNVENPQDSDIALEYRISVPPKKYSCLIYQIVSLPWLMQLEWDQYFWFDLPYETVVKSYLHSPKTKIRAIENEKGVSLYEIAYDTGFLLMIDNLTDSKYKWTFTFKELKDLKIDLGNAGELIDFISEPKVPYFLRIAAEGKKMDPNFNLNYRFDLERLSI